MISISLIPNFKDKDALNCWKLLKNKVEYKGSGMRLKLELERYLGRSVSLTESGRNALYLLLKAWGIGEGDEVVVQALTCSVVPMAIKAVGAKVVYVDIDSGYNLDLEKLKETIGVKTKVVIVQHTFGKPVDMEEVRKICRSRKIKIIEDLAHGLGNTYKDRPLGSWGDGAILSFGRDKVISGIWGGAVVGEKGLIKKIESMQSKWPKRNREWVEKQLSYVIWARVIIRTYETLGMGKFLHWFLRKKEVLSEVITAKEKKGVMEGRYAGLADELCWIALGQIRQMDELIEHRKMMAKLYSEELKENFDPDCSYLRYSIRVFGAEILRQQAATRNIFLGDWYDKVVAPKSVDPEAFGYVNGSCPRAEKVAREIINLPTNPNIGEVEAMKVVSIIKKWRSKK